MNYTFSELPSEELLRLFKIDFPGSPLIYLHLEGICTSAYLKPDWLNIFNSWRQQERTTTVKQYSFIPDDDDDF